MSRFTSFQKLALSTTVMTYFLILVGGLVRASGAGLGCPDWPRCFGLWIPPASAAELPKEFDASQFNPTLMWTEYLNRILGVTVGLLIFATLISAWRHHRHTPQIIWPTVVAFLLVGFEGWLGGVVVEHELAPWLVTIHLLLALVIVSLLLYATVYALFDGASRGVSERVRDERRPLMLSAVALMIVTVGQVVLGAQVRGGIDDALLHGTPRTELLNSVGAMDVWHRDGALVVAAVTVLVAVLVWNRHRHELGLLRAAIAVCALVAIQILLGITMAYVSLTPAAQIAHLTASSLLLGSETVLVLLARWLPPVAAGLPPSLAPADRHSLGGAG